MARPPLDNTKDNISELTGDEKIIAEAKKRFTQVQENQSEIRREAIDDINFRLGVQWPDAIQKDRATDDRPCLVINRLHGSVCQVVNEGKQNRPAPKVIPVDAKADPKTADVIEGLIRHIQYRSDSASAFDSAFESAVTCGIGFYRALTDYQDEESWDQEICIKRIPNPFTVYFPFHLCKEADFHDAPYCFVTDDIPKDEFQEQYPDIDMASWPMSSEGDREWYTTETVKVAEYFVNEETKKVIYKLADGTTTDEKPKKFESKRTVKTHKIMWYKMTMGEILDSRELPGNFIPVFPVTGVEIEKEGKKYFISLIRFAKDPQRMLNYWNSAETEMIALAPKSPFVGAAGQFTGFEQQWKLANKKNLAYLQYNPVAENGAMLPAPARQQQTQVPTAIVNAIRESADDIKATTMLYDASLGAQGNETSGRAINARQRQGNTSNFHFYDNLAKSIRSCFKWVTDVIPTIYDTPRIVRILGPDMAEEIKVVNAQYHQGQSNPGGQLYDLTAGRYDVQISVGPTFATKRAEAADQLIQMMQNNPMVAQGTADLLAKFLDFPDEVVERLKKMLPPQLQDQQQGGPGQQQQQDPRLIQMVQQQGQQLQQAQTLIKQLDQTIQTMDAELKSKDADRLSKLQQTVIKAEAEIAKAKLDQGHEVALTGAQNAHDAQMAQADRAHEIIKQVATANLAPQQAPVQNTAPGPAAPGGETSPSPVMTAGPQ